jgi:hypothetical protein
LQEEEEREAQRRLARFQTAQKTANDGKPKRDEWMIVPPKSEDWASKVDPTKIKNRKFQTGKGAKAPQRGGGENTLWTETPEQKRQRLEDEVMGRIKPATQGPADTKHAISSAEAEETARRIKEYNVCLQKLCAGVYADGLHRVNIATRLCMTNTNSRPVSRRTTPASGRLTEKRISQEAARSATSRREKCSTERLILDHVSRQALTSNVAMWRSCPVGFLLPCVGVHSLLIYGVEPETAVFARLACMGVDPYITRRDMYVHVR